MSRTKAKIAGIKNRAEFETALNEAAQQQLEIEKNAAAYNARKAEQEKAHKAAHKERQHQLAAKLIVIEAYAEAHREELFGDKQSSETALADFGFRKSPGKLVKLNSKWSAAKTIATLKAAGLTVCLKITESLDKAALKKNVPEDELPRYGLRMEYGEEFWIEPKKVLKTE